LRADVKLCESWPATGGTIRTPIAALSGAQDPIDPPESMHEWGRYTESPFVFGGLPGPFFLRRNEAEVLRFVAALIAPPKGEAQWASKKEPSCGLRRRCEAGAGGLRGWGAPAGRHPQGKRAQDVRRFSESLGASKFDGVSTFLNLGYLPDGSPQDQVDLPSVSRRHTMLRGLRRSRERVLDVGCGLPSGR